MSRIVRPETTTLVLANGDALIVKKRLNHGEQQAAFARMYATAADGTLAVNPLQTSMAMMTAYLLDWTMMDDQGVIIQIRDQSPEAVEQVLNTFDPDSVAEIRQAITAHVAQMTAQRTAEKNALDGALGSPATSPSPAPVTGPTNGYSTSTSTSTTSSWPS